MKITSTPTTEPRLRAGLDRLRRARRQLLGRRAPFDSRDEHPSVPEWEREEPVGLWDPARRLVQSMRQYQKWRSRSGLRARVMRRVWVVPHRFWEAVLGADIPIDLDAGGGFIVLHGQGVVVHGATTMGPNCVISQGVTLGTTHKRGPAPRLGAGIHVGPGAKILGGVTIGDGARIGANAVVLHDVPEGALAVGIPARSRRATKTNERE